MMKYQGYVVNAGISDTGLTLGKQALQQPFLVTQMASKRDISL